jgi:spore coat polysaccharide biosynthesis protein SpsF (cytidylyltransferase family)
MIAIIQSRISSKRLPGKALMVLDNRPLLSHVVTRVKAAKLVTRVIVATSDSDDADVIHLYCLENGVECFRGSLDDVAFRFAEAAIAVNTDSFVRISGDSPLIDPAIIDIAISHYNSGNYDLVTNVQKRTFPKGQSVEVVRLATFLEMYKQIDSAFHKQHVTAAFYESPTYKIYNFIKEGVPEPNIQLSIDTKQDFDLIKKILKKIGQDNADCQKLIEIYRSITTSSL